MFKKKQQPELTIDIIFTPIISRWFVFRFLWLFLAIWPLWVTILWFSILGFVQFWHMLILGERSEPIWKRQMTCIRFYAAWYAYFYYFIDTRPRFWLT